MGQIGSGFGLIFFKFWSGFSPDFTFLSPENKVEALQLVSHLFFPDGSGNDVKDDIHFFFYKKLFYKKVSLILTEKLRNP